MRIIGVDLALTGSHKAVVADARGQPLSPVLSLHTAARDLRRLLERAREGTSPEEELVFVMEPTGMAWFPVAAFALRQPQATVYLVNSQQVADLRRYYQKHHKSDRIDARVLVKLPVVSPEKLHPLSLPTAAQLACQRGSRELDRLMSLHTALQNRLQAIERFAWPGLEALWPETLSRERGWLREHWYDPRTVVQAGADALRLSWCQAGGVPVEPSAGTAWADRLVALAQEVVALYGVDSPYLDYGLLQAEVKRERALLDGVAEERHDLQIETVRPLYRQLHPSRHLDSWKGVGQDGAAVFAGFIRDPERFADGSHLRSWSGMILASKQSGENEASGLRITQAGPDLVKKFAYLDADTASKYDPQLAALYYDQMVPHGKHHCQAVCTCATHLLDWIWVVLREDRPYELRDVEGRPVTDEEAQRIIAERYTVPTEVRQRNNQRHRRARAEARAEKQQKRGKSLPSRFEASVKLPQSGEHVAS